MNWLGPNWKTTIGGVLAGIPPLIISSSAMYNVPLPPWVLMLLSVLSGIGALITGVAAKDSTTHSTTNEVQAATKPPVNQ